MMDGLPPQPRRGAEIDWRTLDLEGAAGVLRAAGWQTRNTGTEVLLALGELVAVRIEPHGKDALARLEHAHGALPKAPEVHGYQDGARVILYRATGFTQTTVGLHGTAAGVSVLAAGREIALPPTRDARRLLAWTRSTEPDTMQALRNVPTLPDWLFRASVDSIQARQLWTDATRTDAHGALPCTDVGNAERIARAHGADLRWVEAWDAWLAWDGRRWTRDETGEVVRRAIDTVRQIGAEAAACQHEGERKALLTHAIKSESRGAIMSAVLLLRSQAGLAATPEAFDADPWILNCRNGLVDLRTGELWPHRRDAMCTKMCPVDFNPAAPAPAWEAFLASSLPDAEVRAYVQRLAGYAATGVIREHVLPIHYGGGGNGKSTLTEALLHVLGEYAQQVPTSVLMSHEHDVHPTEKATLRGLRLAACSETAKGRALDEAQVKALTGGERISARVMRGDFFEFDPTHTLWLSTNNKPTIRETSSGIWRRVHLIPWVTEIPKEQQDTELPAKIRSEAEGVLRWVVDGCLAWGRTGLAAPDAVVAATQEYRAESDWLGDFLAARTGPGDGVMAGALYKSFCAWCEVAGQQARSQTAFGRAMNEKGIAKHTVGGYPRYKGIALRDVDPRCEEAQPWDA